MRIRASRDAGPAISLQRSCACGGSGSACTSCDDKKKKGLHRSASGAAMTHEIPSSVHDVLRSPGQPLETAARGFFESRFAHDFSGVRVHAGREAASASRDVAARAWTVGSHIAFAPGEYDPSSTRGRQLLAHELTHVVQQKSGDVPSGISSPSDASERAADNVAARVASGGSAGMIGEAAPMIARVPLPQPHSSQKQPQQGGNPASPNPRPQPQPGAPGPMDLDWSRPLPPRGPNPAACLDPLCQRIRSAPGTAAIRGVASSFRDDAINCVAAGAPASNATHADAIVANERTEIGGEISDLDSAIPPREFPRRIGEYKEKLLETCTRKRREIEIEFHYNIVLANDILQWGRSEPFDQLVQALALMPERMVWGNPVAVTITRRPIIDGNPSIGGGTLHWTGRNVADMEIANAGMERRGFGRSSAIGISSSQQSITHEFGHVVQHQLGAEAIAELYDTIMDYHTWNWAAAAAPVPAAPVPAAPVPAAPGAAAPAPPQPAAPAPVPAPAPAPAAPTPAPAPAAPAPAPAPAATPAPAPAASPAPAATPAAPAVVSRRQDVLTFSGLTDPQLTALMNRLVVGVPVTEGARQWVKEDDLYNRGQFVLATTRGGQMPIGTEWTYALSNREDYFSETFAFSVAAPTWLVDHLPAAQTEWLRRRVFHTPANAAEWSQQLAMAPMPDDLIPRLLRLYTWEQMQPLIDDAQRRAANPREGAAA